MKKIFKKSLAIMVSAAICLTALIGCLSVSAATRGEGTFTVGSDSGKPGESVTVPIELTYTSTNGQDGMGIAASLFDVSYNTDALTITDIAAGEDATRDPGSGDFPGGDGVPPQDIYTVDYRSMDGETISVVDDAVRILAMPADSETVLTSMTVKLTFTINEGAAARDYAITITKQQTCDYGQATPDELGNFTYADDEEFIAMEITNGKVTVKEDEVQTSPIEIELYLDGSLDRTEQYDSLALALNDAADYANEQVGDSFYDPKVVVNEDITLTEDIAVGAYVTLVLGDNVITKGAYNFDLTSSGVVKANYQIPDFANNVFIKETLAESEYTYTNNLQLTMSSASLTLSSQIYINFTASKTGSVAEDVEYGLEYYKVSDPETKYYVPNDKLTIQANSLKAASDGIPAKEMNDDLVARFYAKSSVDNSVYYIYSNSVIYSVVDYADAILNNPSSTSEAKTLMKDMLNYGAQAQLYFSYNTQSLANAILPEEDREISSDKSAIIEAKKPADIGYNSTGYVGSVSLVLLDAVNINYYTKSTVEENTYELLVWNAQEYAQLVAEAADSQQELGNLLVEENCSNILEMNPETKSFTLEGIAAKKFADTYYVRMVEETDSATYYDLLGTYSITQYCADIMDTNFNLANSMAIYSQSARVYFDNYVIDSCVD